MPDNPRDTRPPPLWALLVGIDQYASPTLRDLGGCVNDARALAAFLTDRLGVPSAQVRVLENAAASRAGLIQAFREFLVDNPAIAPGSQLLFAFSGHGSQMRSLDPRELDGYNETLVTQDARTIDPASQAPIRDLPDKTLAALIRQLARAKGDQITVLLDCCHSGSGTRDPGGPGALGERRAPPDTSAAPADLDAAITGPEGPATRGGGPSGWDTGGVNHVLLAGCRDGESSYEYTGPEGTPHGALTYFLLRELQALGPDTSYADLHERVAAQVNGVYRNQLPQCEGDRSRKVFGGARLERQPFLRIAEVQGDRARLAAGLAHGLGRGARLAAHPPTLRSAEELAGATPLAILTVDTVAATSAWATVAAGADGQVPALPEQARAVVVERGYEGLVETVAVLVADPAAEAAAAALRAAIAASPYLEAAAEPAAAALRVEARPAGLFLYGQGGELLVDPASLHGDPAAAATALEVIARARALLRLRNQAQSTVQGAVTLGLRRFQPATNPLEMPRVVADAGGELSLTLVEPAEADANRYLLEIGNGSGHALYPHVFYVGADHSITRLYPRQGEMEAIPARRLGLPRQMGGDAALFRVQLEPGEAAAREQIKVVLTTQPADLGLLEQRGVTVPLSRDASKGSPGSALAALVAAVAGGAGSRGAQPDALAPGEDWGVAELVVNVVRAAATAELPADGSALALGQGVQLRGPAGLAGRVTLRTQDEAARGEGRAPAPPPALAEAGPGLRPVTLAASRGPGSGALVLDLAVDEAARARVSAAEPLRISLPAEAVAADEQLLAIAFDGEDYLLAGSGAGPGSPVLALPGLPPAAAGGATGERGLENLVRFFIYKKLGRATPALGLRALALDAGGQPRVGADGWPLYEAPAPGRFRAGERVALLVHGFSDDSRALALGLGRGLQAGPAPYQQILTFDYETFGTGVARNGEDLALALTRHCGFGPDDGLTLDVYAHSMGGLVSRCLVELSGGAAYVDRLVLAGAPSNGTPWANTARGLAYAAALALNSLTPASPAALAGLALGLLRAEGAGLADLVVDADIARQLNALDEPDQVPYLVLAGTNEAGTQAAASADRLARKTLGQGLDAFFGGPNDAVIGHASLRAVRLGAYPRLTVTTLGCDHGGYFLPAGLAAIRAWRG